MRGIVLIVIASALLLVQCKEKNAQVGTKEILIEGKYLNANNAALILENLSPMGYFPLDTVMTDGEGDFEFRLEVSSIGIYRIRNAINSFLVLIISPGERAHVEADALNVNRTFKIEGPIESELMYQAELRRRYAYDRVDSLSQVWQQSKDSSEHLALKTELDSMSELIFQQYRSYLENFIDSNSDKLCSIFAVYAQLAQRNVFNDKQDIAWFEKVAKGLAQSYPEDPHTLDFNTRVESIKKSMEEEKQ